MKPVGVDGRAVPESLGSRGFEERQTRIYSASDCGGDSTTAVGFRDYILALLPLQGTRDRPVADPRAAPMLAIRKDDPP
jgi:hypothetical protein